MLRIGQFAQECEQICTYGRTECNINRVLWWRLDVGSWKIWTGSEQIISTWPCRIHFKLRDIFAVCWQAWRVIRLETAVAMNKGCHDVGLRMQHLGYHNSWDCWYFTLLYGLGYCTVLVLAVHTDGRWKLAATYCNSIRCLHCSLML